MIWGSIKAVTFVGVAAATGVFCATYPIGGKTIAQRLQESPAPHASTEAARPRREAPEAPTPTPGGNHPGVIDPQHQVARVLPDDHTGGDAYRQEEREAITHLIQQKAKQGRPAGKPR
jgi:hypothetical protein